MPGYGLRCSTGVGATEVCLKGGCIAAVPLPQRQKWIKEDARLIAHGRTKSRVAVICRMAWELALQRAVCRRAALRR